jgi:hypothetical protein
MVAALTGIADLKISRPYVLSAVMFRIRKLPGKLVLIQHGTTTYTYSVIIPLVYNAMGDTPPGKSFSADFIGLPSIGTPQSLAAMRKGEDKHEAYAWMADHSYSL